ncbi:hypothetical protein HN51_002202 [Arachis hypogaea]|uniref:Ionotropic glutamate receptor C-terminal domain-containing protein n=2 Tax=Arachis TaxID=3817 RepID=A0A445ENB6_ARAHY|nr:glutamate receptor 2.8 [Arachis duranensis]XP_025607449.1 glutamate receptor 2.8-like [Arachis hypogaea]QHO50376.1 Glutamate receptor 2 [Arachis hypogaea]RYR76964.1 hypothetical protein Ahy_A01g001459 [Arachis hypogaea]
MGKINYFAYIIIQSWYLMVIITVAEFESVDSSVQPLLGGKKLIIGIPLKTGFTEFVEAKLDPTTLQLVHVSGYSIDIFSATVDYIKRYSHFNVSYEFRPFIKNGTGQSAGSYDKLVQQVSKHQYDAVVGDVSIVAERTRYVDFTLPYAESGVRMLVRVGYGGRGINMWIFLRPFSWDLWLSIILVCAFIGAAIRFMERRNIHNNNNSHEEESAQGSPPPQQLKGISILWLPIDQLFLPQRESVGKNCSKFVLVVWLILGFVLMQSYTANLSSMLTVDQLQQNYPSVDDLRTNGDNIGYPTDSYLSEVLVDKFKFDKSRLKNLTKMEDYQKALDKGTPKGGVDVIFEEIPYIKMFLKKYGSKYNMVGPHYRTDGLGFAFPINSNLTSYFSRAILNVTQNDSFMQPIEMKYFGSSNYDFEDDSYDQLSTSTSSDGTPSLNSQSFAGLFIITGIATFLALVVSESNIWRKPVTLAKVYSQKFLLMSPSWAKSKQSMDVSTKQGNKICSISEPNSIPESPSRFPKSNLALDTVV